jgi:hypothetical protein
MGQLDPRNLVLSQEGTQSALERLTENCFMCLKRQTVLAERQLADELSNFRTGASTIAMCRFN